MRTTTAPISGEGVLRLCFMTSIAYVATPVPCFVSLEVIEACGTALRQWSSVTVMGIKAIVDVAVKSAMAAEPWASSNKDPAGKPVGTVVAVRSAVIRGIVEVPVRTHGSRSDVDADGHLGSCFGSTAE
jgi:hypothetical protein